MKIVNVQGRKKTGKTTTVTSIIAELCRRGYSVGSIKGIHIDDFTLDPENEDTGKHRKAGANPVTARCHGETDIMFSEKMGLDDIIRFYDTQWIVIESHVDLRCPNVVTGRDIDGEKGIADQINEYTICASGVISNDFSKGPDGLPIISAVTDIEKLVDIIEEKTWDYTASKSEGTEGSKAYDGRMEGTGSSDDSIVSNVPSGISYIENQIEFPMLTTDSHEEIYPDGTCETVEYKVLNESQVDILLRYSNGNSFTRVETLPYSTQYATEFALGWLLAEGYITALDTAEREIESIKVNEAGDAIFVTLRYANGNIPGHAELSPVTPINWDATSIFTTGAVTRDYLPLRETTGAAHCCYIAKAFEYEDSDKKILKILFACEDAGRHSAVDKCIGWAIRNHVDLSDCILFASGRISGGMAQKAIRAGVPVIVGKALITQKSRKLAKENSLTLIGFAGDRLKIFNRP